MAGVITAFKNITSDPLWFVKIGVFSIPLYLFFTDKKLILSFFPDEFIFYLVLGCFYLGISSVLINRNINNKSPILPFILDIIELIKKTIGAVISTIPSLVIIVLLLHFIDTSLNLKEIYIMNIIKISVVVLMFPFLCIPVVIYSARGKILDVIRSSRIFFDSGSFIEHFLWFLIQSIFIVGIASFLLYMGLKQYVGTNNIYVYILYSFLITLYILMIFSWASDLYGDVIPEVKDKNRKSIIQ